MRKLSVIFVFALFAIGLAGHLSAQDVPSCKECIVIYGDSRTGHNTHRKIVADIMKLEPKIVFHVGDMVAKGHKERDWQKFNDITQQLRKSAEFFPVMGNHERESALYFKNFSLSKDKSWYSLDRMGIHFIILDSNLPLDWWSKQHRWLQGELKKFSIDKSPVIVLLHQPPVTIGHYARQAKALRQKIAPLFEKYGVVAVFSGDDHNYQRALRNNIYYVITGGGGAPLHSKVSADPENQKYNQKFAAVNNFCTLSIAGNQISVKAYDIDLNLIDEFSFTTTKE
jgi:hypothetical protein